MAYVKEQSSETFAPLIAKRHYYGVQCYNAQLLLLIV